MSGRDTGIDAFFAGAGEPIEQLTFPSEPPAFDRDRLIAAFAKYGASHCDFPGAATTATR